MQGALEKHRHHPLLLHFCQRLSPVPEPADGAHGHQNSWFGRIVVGPSC